ncbi:type II toxin-antitoxin system YafQ family toxin [Patescibacteria group bacterium]
MKQLILSSAFQRQLKKLTKKDPSVRIKIQKTLKTLLKNPQHPTLKLHKLGGENNWAVSITYNLRLVIHFSGEKIFCLRLGSHDQVY